MAHAAGGFPATSGIMQRFRGVPAAVKQSRRMANKLTTDKGRLRVCRVVDIPLREVSGICLRRGPRGRMSLLAIGDRKARLAWLAQPVSEQGPLDWQTTNLARLPGSELPTSDPQIEAICADGAGQVLLLQESPPRAELIDAELARVIASIHLIVAGKSRSEEHTSELQS